MFRPKLLFTSLAALALGACSPQDPQAVTSAAIAKSVILPTYTRWVEACLLYTSPSPRDS